MCMPGGINIGPGPTNATYTIYHANGSTTVVGNQQPAGVWEWHYLATVSLAPGQNHRVELSGAKQWLGGGRCHRRGGGGRARQCGHVATANSHGGRLWALFEMALLQSTGSGGHVFHRAWGGHEQCAGRSAGHHEPHALGLAGARALGAE